MKDTDFKKFLNTNQLSISKLPQPIQDKIKYYKELQELISKTEASIHPEIKEDLEHLDYEILMDIQYEYQDKLENNERLEKLSKCPLVKKNIKQEAVSQLHTDETILKELVDMGRTKNLGKKELIAMGIKTKIRRDTIIGNYILKRISPIRFRYEIILIEK